MSKRGRPRKVGKRTKGGRLKKRRYLPDRVEPTPEMKRHKRMASDQEVGNPLSYIKELSNAQKEALTAYFGLCRVGAPERRVGIKTSSLADYIGGGRGGMESDEERDRAIKASVEAAQGVLKGESPFCFFTVEFIRLSTNEVKLSPRHLEALQAGATALMDHFHIKEERAA